MKVRAAILTELKQRLAIEEIESSPLRFGQVLVKIHCSGICGAQINEIEGAKGPDKFLPHLLGHEATATVQEIGEGVSSVKPSDRVVCHWRKCVWHAIKLKGKQVMPRFAADWYFQLAGYRSKPATAA